MRSCAPSGFSVDSSLSVFIRVYLGPSGSFGFALVHSGVSRCGQVHPGQSGFTRARLGVVGFIHSVSRGFTAAGVGIIGIISVLVVSLGASSGRWVNLCSLRRV